MAPDEVAERAERASNLANSVDPQQREVLARRLGIRTGDMAAYYLNPDKALPELQRRVDTTLIEAERIRAGFRSGSQSAAERLYELGITPDEAREGFGLISQVQPTAELLSQTRGAIEEIGLRDLEDEVFAGDGDAGRRRSRLASQERARFSGSGGTGADTFGRDRQFN
ncbi:hypothetical protein EF847_01605 [Actinobacteria bacterium YIM 96077]|uniref:Uncharacterized protein n=1 Tax=Phytoactinopolyspora halophila TaxID=1981511 RepID=A0A329QIK6_9ACTN|nr:hypothetical protein EF847_01605 [Actinobacteria bacterium YIM 96077]RAW11162.1 hypothetical protein DPM12_17630 [Phytoactinopolyspora halophila]